MEQQAEAFLKANNQKDGGAHLSQQTEILLYSICNGTFATVAFFVFLYFIFRLVYLLNLNLNFIFAIFCGICSKVKYIKLKIKYVNELMLVKH